jgi:hypothetical protein
MKRFFKGQPWWIYAVVLGGVIVGVAIEISEDKHFKISSYLGIALFLLIVLLMLVATIIVQRPQFTIKSIFGVTILVAIFGSIYACLGKIVLLGCLVLIGYTLEIYISGRGDSN